MKKRIIVLAGCLIVCMSACTKNDKEPAVTSREYTVEDITTNLSSGNGEMLKEDEDVSEKNREMIAEALEIDKDSRNIRFILGALDTIHAGKLQSVKAVDMDGEQTLEVLAEDGVSYRIYLSGNGSVNAVENLVTGEWPIQSQK